MQRGVIVHYNLLLSTNKMAIENFNVKVDIQITILKPFLFYFIEKIVFVLTL